MARGPYVPLYLWPSGYKCKLVYILYNTFPSFLPTLSSLSSSFFHDIMQIYQMNDYYNEKDKMFGELDLTRDVPANRTYVKNLFMVRQS